MSVRRIEEEQLGWLPGLSPDDLPHPLPAGLTLYNRQGQVGLRARGVVGTMPLGNGETLQIVPKVGQANFLRMLYRALGAHQVLDRQFEDFARYSESDEATVSNLAARQLALRARDIMKLGATITRSPVIRRGRAVEGQLIPDQTALAVARRDHLPVVNRVRERHRSTPENRMVRDALHAASRILPKSEAESVGRIARTWEQRVTRERMRPRDISVVQERLARKQFGGPRDYYQPAVVAAMIVLGIVGVATERDVTVEGDAHLLDSALVFESYLREVIKESLGPQGYYVGKSGRTPRSLYLSGRFGLEPDIVIERDQHTILIADAKYKRPDSGDHYQLLSYLRAHDLKAGMLLSPAYEGEALALETERTPDGYRCITIGLPLDDPIASEGFLAGILDHI